MLRVVHAARGHGLGRGGLAGGHVLWVVHIWRTLVHGVVARYGSRWPGDGVEGQGGRGSLGPVGRGSRGVSGLRARVRAD